MTLAEIDKNLVPIIFVAGVALLAWTVMRMRGGKPRGGTSGASLQSNAFSPGARPQDVRAMAEEVSKLLVDMQEAARRISSQIDNRYQKLDAVIADAERTIKRLEALKAELDARSEAGRTAEITVPRRAETPTCEDPQHRAIYDMAAAGRSPREIAQAVGKQPGEVELILALQRKPITL